MENIIDKEEKIMKRVLTALSILSAVFLGTPALADEEAGERFAGIYGEGHH